MTNTRPAATATSSPLGSQANDSSRLTVDIAIDTSKLYPISPLIYGVSDSSAENEAGLSWIGATMLRWGGNARTRHNWEINASNAGADWEFRNISQGDSVPGSASLLFMQRNVRLGAWSMLTIPTIGWVARDGNNDSRSLDVPDQGGPAISEGSDTTFTRFANGTWSEPYDPAENRARTSVQSLPTKGKPFSYPPDLTDGKVYQDEWIDYLRSKRPPDAPPVIYAMDNEPELWSDNTHVDIHPARLGYNEQLLNFLTYATAVKNVDPSGIVAGPQSWGPTAYVFSALDEGGDGYRTAADRAAHGGLPWLQWFLMAVNDADKLGGRRTLDVLNIHYYPQSGVYGGGNTAEMQDKRMQAPRVLWDTTYTEPSWVARTEWPQLAITRRLHRLIEQNYPGTKLGIGEWNFGGDDDISGAIAIADTLGVFGRERVYSAAYWGQPQENSPAGWAFRLYRNYDGNGASFGTQSVETTSNNTEDFSAYAALTEDSKKLTVVMINKKREQYADAKIDITGFASAPNPTLYSYGPGTPAAITASTLPSRTSGVISVAVPPMSINLLVLDR